MIGKIFRFLVKLFFILLLIALCIFFILVGLYYSKISKKSYPFQVSIDAIGSKMESYLSSHDQFFLGDDFQVEGDIDFQLESEMYARDSALSVDAFKKNNTLRNLSLMDTHFLLQHYKSQGVLYTTVSEKIGEEEIFGGKYLISDFTRCYFVNGVLDQYVNFGGNNYFETLNEENTSRDNINYLYHFILDTFKNHIKDEDIQGYDAEINLGEDTRKVGAVSLKVTNQYIRQIFKDVLKDLKKDKKASEILSTIYPDFMNAKLDDGAKYLSKEESYTITIYVSKLLFSPLKYEITHLKENVREVYTYEGDTNSGIYYYSFNNEVRYSAEYDSNSKKGIVNIFDKSLKSIGTISLDKDVNNFMFTLTLDLEKDKYDISYSRKYMDFVKNKSYQREDFLTLKIMRNMVNEISGNVKISSNVRAGGKNLEDSSLAVLEMTLTEDEKQKFETVGDRVRKRLESE